MNLRTTALAALSGLLLAVSFPALNLHFIAWFSLVPLLYALRGKTVINGLWIGGITGIVYFAGTIHWVTNSIHFYGGISLVPASLITLLLCSYLALYPALFSAASVHLRNGNPGLFFITAPILWTALELSRTYVFSGFPWDLLGYTQYSLLPVIQIADITGVYGVSFLIVLVNVSIAEFMWSRKKWMAIAVAIFAIAITLGYGFFKLRSSRPPDSINLAVVQGNIEQAKKWDPVYQSEVVAIYKNLTLEALKERPDLVIWPETATPFHFDGRFNNDKPLTEDLISFVKQNNVPLLFGSPIYKILPNRQIISRNSAYLLSGEGLVIAEYSKIHLVPFGEYVPLKKFFFFINKLTQALGDTEAGHTYTIMTIPYGDQGQRKDIKFCTVICYEIIFPNLVRRFVKQGASMLTNITNDAWFGKTSAPYQHFSMAVFRAVENRVPVARAANTGISGFIDAQGRILGTTEIFTPAYLTHKLIPGSEKSFYTLYGDIFAYGCVIFTLIMLAAFPWKKRFLQ
jgi:apolipoprotein N-acyltransferase